MAPIPVTINGVIIDYFGRTIAGPLKIVGELVRSDVGVGGGPILPPGGGGGGGGEGIWGPGDPRPTPPIANVPGAPGYRPPGSVWPGPGDPDFPGGGKPPGIWPGPGDPDYPAGSPHPEHPIVLPKPPIDGPPDGPPTNPPSSNWDWGWSPRYGWHPVYTPGDKPQPPPVGGDGGLGPGGDR